jgi:hypothetical protein
MFPFFLLKQINVYNSPLAAWRIAKIMLLYFALVVITFGFFYFLVY